MHVGPCSKQGAQAPCIAILLGAPLTPQNIERTGVAWLTPHLRLVIFDCKPWLGRARDAAPEDAQGCVLEIIDSPHALDAALRRHRPSHALDFIGPSPCMPALRALLATHGTRYVLQKTGHLPRPGLWARLLWKLRTGFTPQPARYVEGGMLAIQKPGARLLARTMSAARPRLTPTLPPDLALLAGSAAHDYQARHANEILWVASHDYHLYHLSLHLAPPVPKSEFAVFIDDHLPFASDWRLLGLAAPVTPERYYPAMRAVLDRLESQWQMPVLIAAHPGAGDDQRVRQGLGRRALFHGCSAQLVRQAKAVLLHGSTAVSFAVLAEKPMLFLTSDELQRCPFGLHVQTLARELGQEPLNIDTQPALPLLDALHPNPDLLTRYVERYLCSCGCQETAPWQAFIEHLGRQVPQPEAK